MGEYSTDFYAGMPALTKNKYGNGTAYYIAFESTFPDDDFLKKYYASLVSGHGIKRNLDLSIPAGVSVRKRSGAGYDYFFIQNFLDEPKVIDVAENTLEDALFGNKVQSPLNLAGYGSVVLKRPK
jgi:beta-galactosidase